MSANLELLCASSPLDDEDLPEPEVHESQKPGLRRRGLWSRLAASVMAPRRRLNADVTPVQANLRCA